MLLKVEKILNKNTLDYLRRAVELAEIGLNKGDEPFGSILVLDDKILFEGHNEISSGDNTRHPEFELSRWAANNLTTDERKRAIVYTSGEHCPMCAAAHAWVGLGTIYYASSTKQLVKWYEEFNFTRSNVKPLSINDVIINTETFGPFYEFEETIKQLHKISVERKKS